MDVSYLCTNLYVVYCNHSKYIAFQNPSLQNRLFHKNMKRLLTVLVLTLFATMQIYAQMSDEQVVEYVQQQQGSGKSQQVIALELQQKGVTREQMLRLKEKYERMQQEAAGSASVSQTSGSSIRKANGSQKEGVDDFMMEYNSELPSSIFGHDIFNSKKLTFEPNMNIATPANYTLGPGDELIIDIYGVSQSNSKYEISPEGTIVVGKIGPIEVSGLTVEQAQEKVINKMGMHYQGSNIKVTVGQTRTVLVNILGEVKNPGTYTLSAFSTVFNALYLAGGITDIGTLRNIKVTRNGRTISTVDVYDFILNGKLTGNVMLKDNDAIIVGAYDVLVSIEGAVKRPMYYEMKRGESLSSLIEYSGGLQGNANKSVINVERKTSDGHTVHSVNEWDFSTFGLEDGDAVTINSIVKRYQNMVDISGAVFYAGHYSMSDGCNTVKGLITKAGGLLENAFRNRAVLYRLNDDRTRKAMSIDLKNILDGNAPDVALENEDQLVIAWDERIQQVKQVHIFGPVHTEGALTYAEGMTLEDAIIAAGGLKEEALLSNIEISRRIQYTDNRDTTYLKQTEIYTFAVEDGLVVGQGKEFVLKPYDAITIRKNPEYASSQFVYVYGEVKYPGTYVLKSKSERISDIIARAGGLNSNAFADGVKFTRYMQPDEKARAEQLLEMSQTRSDSIDSEKIQIKERYSVGIDLSKILKKPGCTEDIVLRGGDQITIPQFNNTVKINGEVLYPNTVSYVEGKSGRYYLNQAGGVSTTGRKSKAYIIYANGQVSRLNKGKVMPGCEIVVPSKRKKGDNTQKSNWALAGVSTLATVSAVIVAALR